MSKPKVLIQDIADSLNLSRTTVSKVLNNTGSVSPQTRERVLQRAAEMNYKYFSLLSFTEKQTQKADPDSSLHDVMDPAQGPSKKQRQIAFFFSNPADKVNASFFQLPLLSSELRKKNLILSVYSLSKEDLKNQILPENFQPNSVVGILCIEMLDKAYAQMLCSLHCPLLFIDGHHDFLKEKIPADFLLPESMFSVMTMTQTLIERYRLRRVGFVGTPTHCMSFFERWMGYRQALQNCGLLYTEEDCILSDRDINFHDPDWLIGRLKEMKSLPDLFVCANDGLASFLFYALRQLQISCPEDVLITGFDHSSFVALEPSLTTINAFSVEMGLTAAQILLARIQKPDLPYSRVHLQTDILYRESTERPSWKSSAPIA